MDHWQSDPKATIRGYRCLLYIHIKPVGAALSFHMFGRDLQTNSLNILRDGGGNYCNTTCLWTEKDEKCIIFSKYIAVAENPCTCWVYDCWDVHSVNRCSISPLICRKGGGGLLQRIRIFHTARLGYICWEVLSTIFVFSID